jgi:hypothetical protein
MADARDDDGTDPTTPERRPRLFTPLVLWTLLIAALVAGGAWGYVWYADRHGSTMPPISNMPVYRPGPDESEETARPSTLPATRRSTTARSDEAVRATHPSTTAPAQKP